MLLQKLLEFQRTLVNNQKTSQKMDDARYQILRVCTMQLTYWVSMKIKADLMAMDNHEYKYADDQDNHYVWHRRNEKYAFSVAKLNGQWICYAPEGRRCWRNVRLGRPYQHVLLVWCQLLRTKRKSFKLDSISLAFNKVYRRTHYMTLHVDSYTKVPAAPAMAPLDVAAVSKSTQMRQTIKLLEVMVAYAEGEGDFLLSRLHGLLILLLSVYLSPSHQGMQGNI